MPGAISNHLQITLFFVLSKWLIAVKCRGAASLQQNPLVSSSLAWLAEWAPGYLSSCDNLAWKRSSTPVCTSYWAEGLCPLGNSFPNSWCPRLKTALQSLWDSLLCRNWPGHWECQCKLEMPEGFFPTYFPLMTQLYDWVRQEHPEDPEHSDLKLHSLPEWVLVLFYFFHFKILILFTF